MLSDIEERSLYDFYICQREVTEMASGSFLGLLCNLSISEVFEVIRNNSDKLCEITTGNIPQYSNLFDVFKVVQIIHDCGKPIDMYELGYYLRGDNRTSEAQRKYGENHYKFACQLGLAKFVPRTNTCITNLGIAFYELRDEGVQKSVTDRLVLRVPILQRILIDAQDKKVDVVEELGKYLSPATVARRRSNMHNALNWLAQYHDLGMKPILDNIEW